MRISLIAAVAENNVIGRDGALPWRLPGDLRHFREITMGKPVVMGRKTYESIGRALPGRANIVVSRDPDFAPDDALVSRDIDEALTVAAGQAAAAGVTEAMVIGGAAIYAGALDRADRIYLTEVQGSVEGDIRFPDFDRDQWREISRTPAAAIEGDEASYSFVVLDRNVTKN